MKQFLRFQISGLTCIFWIFMYYLPCVKWELVSLKGLETVIPVLAVAVTLALPLGTIIHQLSISILSPFRSRRFVYKRRHSLDELKSFSPLVLPITNSNNQYKMAIAQSYIIDSSNSGTAKINIQELRSEISARYSYYYVRVDNGLIAPIISLIAFLISIIMFIERNCPFIVAPSLPTYIIFAFTFIFMLGMLFYVPTLLNEIDDLERFLIRYVKRHDLY
ncbi:hypothetical protein ACR42D_02990 [Desulfovibrio caledoniensis]